MTYVLGDQILQEVLFRCRLCGRQEGGFIADFRLDMEYFGWRFVPGYAWLCKRCRVCDLPVKPPDDLPKSITYWQWEHEEV